MAEQPDPAPHAAARSPGGLARGLALVALVALLAQGATLAGRAVLDDVPVVSSNPVLERGWAALPAAFRQPHWPGQLEQQPWRPLAVASLAVERALLGSEAALPAGHATNLLLHALVAVLSTLIAWRVAPGRRVLGLCVGLVVGAHPLATGAVALLVGRSLLLGTVLASSALWLALGWKPGQPARLAWVAACTLLALLACEAWVALPVVAWLLALTARRADASRPASACVGPVLASLVGAALWLALWWGHGPGLPGVDADEPGPLGRIAQGLEALARAGLHLALPVGWVADRTHEAQPGRGWLLEGPRLVAVFVASVVVLAAWLLPVRRGALAAMRASVLVAASLLVGASLALPLGSVLEDRWASLALPALAVLAGLAAESLAAWAAASHARRVLAGWMPGLVLLCLTLLSVRVARGMASEDAVHARLLALPGSHGPALLRRADRLRQEADRLHAEAARRPVRDNDPWRDPGRAPLLEAARDARAEAMDLVQAATRHPATRHDAQGWLVLALLQLETATPADALETLGEARRLHPLLSGRAGARSESSIRERRSAARIYAALLRAQAMQGKPQAAADAALEALLHERAAARLARATPDLDLLWRCAQALVADGRYEAGLGVLHEVALEHPDPALRVHAARQLEAAREAQAERVASLLRSARASQESPDTMRLAADDYEEALRLDPSSFEARYWAAQIRGMHFGNYGAALDMVREGLSRLDLAAPSSEVERLRARFTDLRQRLQERQAEEDAEESAGAGAR